MGHLLHAYLNIFSVFFDRLIKAKFNGLCILCINGKIHPFTVPGCTQRIRFSCMVYHHRKTILLLSTTPFTYPQLRFCDNYQKLKKERHNFFCDEQKINMLSTGRKIKSATKRLESPGT